MAPPRNDRVLRRRSQPAACQNEVGEQCDALACGNVAGIVDTEQDPRGTDDRRKRDDHYAERRECHRVCEGDGQRGAGVPRGEGEVIGLRDERRDVRTP